MNLSPQRLSPDAYRQIRLRPLALTIGAEIEGVSLHDALAAETVTEIRRALVEWKVIFFRGQHLDHAEHVRFARQFGQPTIGHPVFGHDKDFPEIYSVATLRTANNRTANEQITPWYGWHTDITAAINPPMALILRGVVNPILRRRYLLDGPGRCLAQTVWDNRSTAHLAPSDIHATDGDRQLYRIRLTGQIPLGVDGTSSRPIEGEPILPVEEELALRG